jgi:hypothetical protein
MLLQLFYISDSSRSVLSSHCGRRRIRKICTVSYTSIGVSDCFMLLLQIHPSSSTFFLFILSSCSLSLSSFYFLLALSSSSFYLSLSPFLSPYYPPSLPFCLPILILPFFPLILSLHLYFTFSFTLHRSTLTLITVQTLDSRL